MEDALGSMLAPLLLLAAFDGASLLSGAPFVLSASSLSVTTCLLSSVILESEDFDPRVDKV